MIVLPETEATLRKTPPKVQKYGSRGTDDVLLFRVGNIDVVNWRSDRARDTTSRPNDGAQSLWQVGAISTISAALFGR
jgi:hypothetical protein